MLYRSHSRKTRRGLPRLCATTTKFKFRVHDEKKKCESWGRRYRKRGWGRGRETHTQTSARFSKEKKGLTGATRCDVQDDHAPNQETRREILLALWVDFLSALHEPRIVRPLLPGASFVLPRRRIRGPVGHPQRFLHGADGPIVAEDMLF